MRGVVLAALLGAGCQARAPGIDEQAQVVCARGETVAGIDVSHHEGAIDWARVAGAGVGFAVIKATQGVTFVDPLFADNWEQAGRAGLVRGAYHYFRPEDDPAAQADFLLATAGPPAYGDLPLAIDLETASGLPADAVVARARTFLARLAERTGRLPLVYTSRAFFTGALGGPAGFERYPLWAASWQASCPSIPDAPWRDWVLWQSSSTGAVAGIAGAVDLDRFNGSLAELRAFVAAPAGGPDGGEDGAGAGGPGPDGGAADREAPGGGCRASGGAGQPAGFTSLLALAALCVVVARRRLQPPCP